MTATPYPADSALIPPVEMAEAHRFAADFADAIGFLPVHRPWSYVVSSHQGWGVLQYGRSVSGGTMTLGGTAYTEGFGAHVDSDITLRASAPIRRVTAMVGLDDNNGTRHSPLRQEKRVVFSISAGGAGLWSSPPMAFPDEPIAVDAAVEGDAREITLSAKDTGGVNDWGHVDWADLRLDLADGKTVFPGRACGFSGQPSPVGRVPFSFLYGGRPVSGLAGGWEVRHAAPVEGDRGRSDTTTVWRDPATGLECELVVGRFEHFPAVEWQLRLRNTGGADTPLLEDIRPLDLDWRTPGAPILRTSRGAWSSRTDFLVEDQPLPPGAVRAMEAGGGRSCNAAAPFFNLIGGGAGVILSIGWTGQWEAVFARSGDGSSTRLSVGQQNTRLVLHPGEEISTPRIAMVFWQGDAQAGHNLQRRFMLAHHSPRPNGELLRGPLCSFFWGGMTTAQMLERLEIYRREGLDYDFIWVDAGWYGPSSSISPDEFSGDWAQHVGNWSINPAAHPDGLRPVSDAAQAGGMDFLVWFEPERAICGTPLTREHPEWFLGDTSSEGATLLFNLGDPEARAWLTDAISDFIGKQGIRFYRQDFNMDPLGLWRANDAPDRQGITEIRHVEGLYQFWDDLLDRHPGLAIDNCASGGRRIDLETLGRSIPLWRSDWQCGWTNEPTPGQTHLMGLSMWAPLSGTGVLGYARRAGNTYNFRCSLGPALQFSSFSYAAMPVQAEYPWDWWRARIAEFRRAAPFYYGDYYPLTRDTASEGEWAVYQFHRTDLRAGIVAGFRRAASPFLAARFRLCGLDPDKAYDVEDADTGTIVQASGRDLMEQGMRFDIESLPGSQLFYYTER
ncbi:MAG: alpha-galactosidase [Kiritimatiellia bacterium]|jgi:alpha-galactosidase